MTAKISEKSFEFLFSNENNSRSAKNVSYIFGKLNFQSFFITLVWSKDDTRSFKKGSFMPCVTNQNMCYYRDAICCWIRGSAQFLLFREPVVRCHGILLKITWFNPFSSHSCLISIAFLKVWYAQILNPTKTYIFDKLKKCCYLEPQCAL